MVGLTTVDNQRRPQRQLRESRSSGSGFGPSSLRQAQHGKLAGRSRRPRRELPARGQDRVLFAAIREDSHGISSEICDRRPARYGGKSNRRVRHNAGVTWKTSAHLDYDARSHTVMIAAGQECCPGRRTECGGVELVISEALLRQAIRC
jgi:hypothetical protein